MKKLLFLSFALLLCTQAMFAQRNTAEDAMIEQAVNRVISTKKFTFVANRVLTSGGSQSALKNQNTMTVSNDTLRVRLPYFGKGFSAADTGSDRSPLNFVTTDFKYSFEMNKRGERIVTMEVVSPAGDRFTFTLTVAKGAMAKLLIAGTSRSNMNYSGYIQDAPVESQD
ncbi:DUF4251 domain-containing protein [uncultured Alistipes sp.]|uniref:DUF4251 domain-containing protein n=1 Tax=uncultured Alistipes sp. TaxID=538949 RepID=UPI002606C2EB|nr:DUF4251 domain-containing protein [uncultured Alistipes sp.]